MNEHNEIAVTTGQLWIGRILGGVAVLYLLFDSITHIIGMPAVVEWHTSTLGFPADTTALVGGILLACIILYIIPRTAFIGTVMLTGYLGGAVAINLRIGSSLFHIILLEVLVGILLWGKVVLTDKRVRDLISR